MKKLLPLLLLASALFGVDGYKVFQKNCQSCHIEMISKEETLKKIDTIKAPPMVEVSNRLKENIKTADDEDDVNRHLFILFVKDYIMHPNLEFSMCHAGALEKFGTMPSQKGKITEAEANAVAIWLYDRYEGEKF